MILYVCGLGCPFKSISSAYEQANPHDTIIVKEGIYREHLVLRKPIVLIGIDYPTLDAEGRDSSIIKVKADSVVISGFRFVNTGPSYLREHAALRIEQAKACILRNNIFQNNAYAIYLEKASDCLVENNRIYSSARSETRWGNGIHSWYSDNLVVRNNIVEGQRDGIYFEFTTNTIVENNLCVGNIRYGLHLMFSHTNSIRGNTFRRNSSGIALMYSKKVVFSNNRVFGETVLLKELSDSRIENNAFLESPEAMYMENSNRNEILSNLFQGNFWALRIMANCEDNVFRRNVFKDNVFDVTSNTVEHFRNTFEENFYDRYRGYDLDKDGYGDVPYRLFSLSAVMVDRYPLMKVLVSSFLFSIMDYVEKLIPIFIPETYDRKPLMEEPF